MKKRVFYTEASYFIGLMVLALGNSIMAQGGFGVSMVVAPAYLVHRKLISILPFFSYGMAEYVFQFLLLIVMMLVLGRAKLSYMFSFVTAVFYGFLLDGAMAIVSLIPLETMAARIIFYAVGLPICACGVSLVFRTYLPVKAYELFVKELAGKLGWPIHKMKSVYDLVSCVVAIAMSFAFFGFGHFEGISIGTIICALVNGTLIHFWSNVWDRFFVFRDGLPLRKYF